jgi:hypothetical protein
LSIIIYIRYWCPVFETQINLRIKMMLHSKYNCIFIAFSCTIVFKCKTGPQRPDPVYPGTFKKIYISQWYFIPYFFVFNTTFSNISAISWQPFKWWKKLEYPERTTDHGQAIFCNLQSWARTHAVFVIGLYELLGNPTITHWATLALITI